MRESISLPQYTRKKIKNKIHFLTILPLRENVKVRNSERVVESTFKALDIFPNTWSTLNYF